MSRSSPPAIAVPSGTPNEGAAVRAVNEIRQIIVAYGFGEANVTIEPYGGGREASGPVCLSYLLRGRGPECRHWTTNFAEDPRSLPYPNFGCAAAQPHRPDRQPGGSSGTAHHGSGRASRCGVRQVSPGSVDTGREGSGRALPGQDHQLVEVGHEQRGLFPRR